MNRLAELLEAERAKRDLTLTDFAEQVLGISHSLVSRYVNGIQSPNRRTVRKIADALKVPVSDIDAMLADEDAKRRGRHRPGLGPTGHPDDDDLREIIRQAALEGARQAAEEVVDRMSRRRPVPEPERDPVLHQLLAEVTEAWERMTPDEVEEARACFRVALQRHRREERARLQASQ